MLFLAMQFLKLQRNKRVDSSVLLVVGQEVGNPNFFTSLSRTSLVNNISDKEGGIAIIKKSLAFAYIAVLFKKLITVIS